MWYFQLFILNYYSFFVQMLPLSTDSIDISMEITWKSSNVPWASVKLWIFGFLIFFSFYFILEQVISIHLLGHRTTLLVLVYEVYSLISRSDKSKSIINCLGFEIINFYRKNISPLFLYHSTLHWLFLNGIIYLAFVFCFKDPPIRLFIFVSFIVSQTSTLTLHKVYKYELCIICRLQHKI